MPRKLFVMDSTQPYHLVGRSNNKDWFKLPIQDAWGIYSNFLYFLYFAFNVRIHAFVLMSNHFHLIASFPDGNLSSSMNYFMRETCRSIRNESGQVNHVYGNRIFRSCLSNSHYFEHAYKYVYRNPVEAGVCGRVESYMYSSLSGLLGFNRLGFPVELDTLLFNSISTDSHLNWLNLAPTENSKESVMRALKRPVFKLPKQGFKRQVNDLEFLRY